MFNDNASRIGDFVTLNLWRDAINLLNTQIGLRQKNRHFNTLAMYYYESLGDKVQVVAPEDYFRLKVASNLFYGLEKEFGIYAYSLPKAGLDLRIYKFMTYPLLVLYYTICLYIAKISQEFVAEHRKKNSHIKSFYGGNITFFQDSLAVKEENIYYRKQYKEFREAIRSEIESDVRKKVVIRLDIKDYFDEISVGRLLQLLSENIKPSIAAAMGFDNSAIEQILSFFDFVSDRHRGIPQSDNNIMSAYIGYLYLLFGEMYIDDEIIKYKKMLEKYSITRYLDDIYITLVFREEVSYKDREFVVDKLSMLISETLYSELSLKLNLKTRFYWLDNKTDYNDFLKNIKKVSPEYYIFDEDNPDHPQEKINRIFNEVEELKDLPLDAHFLKDAAVRDEVFKEVFDPNVEKMLSISDNKKLINEIFKDFNFDHIKYSPIELIILLSKDESTLQRYREYLINTQPLTIHHINQIISYLCQTGFQDPELLIKLQGNKHMKEVIRIFVEKEIYSDTPGYYELKVSQLANISAKLYIVDQIRLRMINEKLGFYSVALNHLLNEVHAICHMIDKDYKGNAKNYDSVNVTDCLRSYSVPNMTLNQVRNLFDRRNINQVSHPGSQYVPAWSVSKEEYYRYRRYVGDCLGYIL